MSPTIQLNDRLIDAEHTPAHQSLLDFIRETGKLKGTKEGCASGDCGACTVVVRDSDGSNPRNINSCITPAGAALGKQVITVEGAGTPAQLHPVQKAMVDEHGSQCGFCTPGFVMSIVAAQMRDQDMDSKGGTSQRDAAIESVSGNLCRCTGYRPIIDAALIASDGAANLPAIARKQLTQKPNTKNYARPANLAQLLALLSKRSHTRTLVNAPINAENAAPWLIAGATDAFLEVSQRYLDPTAIVDLSDVAELRQMSTAKNGDLIIGAAVTHTETLNYFSQAHSKSQAIIDVLKRFGSPQIRSRGTLGGNIANASPIADWPPLLIALDASLNLIDEQGEERSLRIDEFYLGYKATQLKANELIKSVQIPEAIELKSLRAHKISKRFEDDISSALAALYLQLNNGEVTVARIGFGGVGPTPMRCRETEKVLTGQLLTTALIDTAAEVLADEITPMSDVRASEEYRREVSQAVLRNLLLAAFEAPAAEEKA